EELLQGATLPAFAGADGLLQVQEDAGRPHFWSSWEWDTNRRQLADDIIEGVAAAPRFVIEELPALPAEGGSVRFGALPEVGFYRVTAYGVGGTADAVAILQTTYRR